MKHSLRGYLTTKQVCEIYGIHRNTLRKWVSDGLGAVKIGTVLLYTKKDVERYLKSKDKAA